VKEVQVLEAQAESTAAALSRARAERVAYLASLARRQRLTRRQIARLDAQAKQGVQRAQIVQVQSDPAAPGPSAPPVAGATLTVTATGYSMSGRTATGLPVGFGIVAVDPSVIPLGTRLTIPGYGEGVAADTGGAVRGYTIDLWFPTLADALAWGRRTVTITLH
jgi:3D (Asp-Asp-Asp) domain-containing protein